VLSFDLPELKGQQSEFSVLRRDSLREDHADSRRGLVPHAPVGLCAQLHGFIHNRADLTLVTSPQIKKELEDEGLICLPCRNSIPNSKAARCGTACPRDFLVVYIGRLGAEKRLQEIKGLLARHFRGTRNSTTTSKAPGRISRGSTT